MKLIADLDAAMAKGFPFVIPETFRVPQAYPLRALDLDAQRRNDSESQTEPSSLDLLSVAAGVTPAVLAAGSVQLQNQPCHALSRADSVGNDDLNTSLTEELPCPDCANRSAIIVGKFHLWTSTNCELHFF